MNPKPKKGKVIRAWGIFSGGELVWWMILSDGTTGPEIHQTKKDALASKFTADQGEVFPIEIRVTPTFTLKRNNNMPKCEKHNEYHQDFCSKCVAELPTMPTSSQEEKKDELKCPICNQDAVVCECTISPAEPIQKWPGELSKLLREHLRYYGYESALMANRPPSLVDEYPYPEFRKITELVSSAIRSALEAERERIREAVEKMPSTRLHSPDEVSRKEALSTLKDES